MNGHSRNCESSALRLNATLSPTSTEGFQARAIHAVSAKASRRTWRDCGATESAIIASFARSGIRSFWCWWWLSDIAEMFTSEPNTQMKQGKRRCTHENRRRLVAVLDRSERDLLRRSEGAGGVPESIRSAPERLLRHHPRHVDEPPTRLRIHARRPRKKRSHPQGSATLRSVKSRKC